MTRRHLRFLPALLILFVFAGGLTGCKQLARLMPAKTIDAPTEGSPEWVVYKFIEGAQYQANTPNVEASKEAWTAVRPLMHSSVLEMANSEKGFVQDNFPAFRRKVNHFTPKDGNPTYVLDYTEDVTPDVELKLFVVNEKSDQPSPFRIARDPAAANQWRIKTIP